MTGNILYVLIISFLSVSTVFGKNNYFEHYFSKYHNYKSSSTVSSTFSTSDVPISDRILSSSQDDITSEEKYSPGDENESKFTVNTITVQQNEGQNDSSSQYAFIARVASIVGSIAFAVIVLGCIVCCCPCCRGTERRGFIIGRRPEVLPQPVIIQTSQQPTFVQNVPPEYAPEPVQHFPPQYQQPVLPSSHYAPVQGYQYSPMQPQNQYSPVQTQTNYSPVQPGYQDVQLHFYNPPEAPPPYEPTAPKQSL